VSTYKHKKILILGDAGRGKSTFAEKLSKKISIPHYSTDDFYWKVKFTEANDKEKSIEEISHVYKQNAWIMEGTTRRLIREGLEKADVIYLLEFNNIIHQYYFLIKRKFKRKHESFMDLWGLLKHVTYKRYKKGYGSGNPPLRELLESYTKKVIRLSSMKEINQYLESVN
jgi:adenylate kinase family enzyme